MSMSETLRIIEAEEELKRLRVQHTQLLNHVRAIFIMINEGDENEALLLMEKILNE